MALGTEFSDNGSVIELTEPQVLVLISVFATAIFGMLSWQTISFNRTVNTAIGSVQRELGFFRESVDARFNAVDAKFDVVNHKIDALDRDVQAPMRNAFGTDPR